MTANLIDPNRPRPAQDRSATAAPLRRGQGRAEVRRVRDQSVVVRDAATSPLKLLCPRYAGSAAWIYTGTFGGGMVAGDTNEMDLHVGPGATAVLTTQAASKIYHQQDGVGCDQYVHATVEAGALLVIGPDPVTCFARAVYRQGQTIDLQGDAALVMVDWMTSGRAAMGERWAFDRYASCNDVRVDGRLTIREAVCLDVAEADPGGVMVTGGCHCLANVILVGEQVRALGEDWLERFGRAPIAGKDTLQVAVSPVAGGVVLRLAGRSTEAVAGLLRNELAALGPRLGRGLWDRKG